MFYEKQGFVTTNILNAYNVFIIEILKDMVEILKTRDADKLQSCRDKLVKLIEDSADIHPDMFVYLSSIRADIEGHYQTLFDSGVIPPESKSSRKSLATTVKEAPVQSPE